ncbi:MAG: sigma-54 dependent transcriptional regulator [Planctomycetota bacterium]
MATILICDDEALMRDGSAATLERHGHQVRTAACGQEALDILDADAIDLLITDLKMPGMTGIELLRSAKARKPKLLVILMTAFATVPTAVSAIKQGALDYLQKPFDGDDLRRMTERALRTLDESPIARPKPVEPATQLVGKSAATGQLKQQIERVATSNATVLIRGESGVGKEVVARTIHAAGDRADKPLIAVNCAALAGDHLEAELFGDESQAHLPGRFERADAGVVLLDEVSQISPGVQAKLLRFLQDGSFERVGGTVTRRVDVRIVATSNADLEEEVKAGRFRADLFYRLDVLPIIVPPLRDRTDDIADLARHFLHRISKRDGTPFRHLNPRAVRMLERHDWPGNVRELQNMLERAVALETEPGVIRAATLEPWIGGGSPRPVAMKWNNEPLAEVEKRTILAALDKFNGHRAKTAGALGIGVRTLGMKLKKWKETGEWDGEIALAA